MAIRLQQIVEVSNSFLNNIECDMLKNMVGKNNIERTVFLDFLGIASMDLRYGGEDNSAGVYQQ